MPISTSSSTHFSLSGGSRSRRRRILWQLDQIDSISSDEEQTVSKTEKVPTIETVMQDSDRISFDFQATFTGLELDEKKELKPITFPDLDDFISNNTSDKNNSPETSDSGIHVSATSESGVFSDSNIIPTGSESSISKASSASFQQFRDLIQSSNPATWLFTGGSITHGSNFTQGYRIYSEHFSERIRTEMKRSNDIVINTAVAGETSQAILEKLDDRITRFQPDVVSLMVGIDDSESGATGQEIFQNNLQTIIEQVRESGSLLFLHTPPYFETSEDHTHADIRAYIKTIRDISREYWIPCLDHWNLWKVAKENNRKMDGWFAPNGVHPSAQGHHELAKQIFQRMEIFDDKSPTCCETVSQIH